LGNNRFAPEIFEMFAAQIDYFWKQIDLFWEIFDLCAEIFGYFLTFLFLGDK
jgi:hypothetical protein